MQANYESFDDLGTALMTVLVVFVGENWNDVWYAISGTWATPNAMHALIMCMHAAHSQPQA